MLLDACNPDVLPCSHSRPQAFGIGLLARLSPRYRHTQALVLSPTKDLAIQTARVLGGLGKHLHLRCHDS